MTNVPDPGESPGNSPKPIKPLAPKRGAFPTPKSEIEKAKSQMPVQSPKRGAIPTPRSTLAAAAPYSAPPGAPPSFIVIPKQLSMWGNDVHGDCVTAEEAFAKAYNNPEIFISDDDVIAWATKHGVLEGANLAQVMTSMQNDGFPEGSFTYDDGTYLSVDWTNAGTLQSAISQGPVKIGIAADQLDATWQSASGQSGWFATGYHDDANEDHCTALCGYGSISWLAQQFGVQVPAGIDGTQAGYAMFTWDSIGIIDVPSMIAITQEAWLRQPTTVIRNGSPTLAVITNVGNVYGYAAANNALEPIFEFSGAKIGYNPQDRFMMATSDRLFVTNNGNVFGATIDVAQRSIGPVAEYTGTRIGYNPQDRFMVAGDGTLFVITNTGDVWWTGIDFSGDTLSPVSHLGGSKIGYNPQDRFMVAIGPAHMLAVITNTGDVYGAVIERTPGVVGVPQSLGPIIHFTGSKIGYNPQDRFMVMSEQNNTLFVITNSGEVFGAAVDTASYNIGPVIPYPGAIIGYNPQDRFMVAV